MGEWNSAVQYNQTMRADEEVVTDPSTRLLIETLENRWQTFRSELSRCRKEPGEEAIHDLRVAARRRLALVDMLRAIPPQPRLGKLRRALKALLDELDHLRDTQVMLADVAGHLSHLPELAPFQEYLVKREKRYLRVTAKAIRSFQCGKIRKRLDSALQALRKKDDGLDRQMPLLHVVDGAYEAAMRRFRRVEPAQPATIHRLRIAFKKFRYMVEIVHPLISNFPDKTFKHMRTYQDSMGAIQDLEIFISVFHDFTDKDVSYDPEPVRRFYQQRHTDAVEAFVREMRRIEAFWRPKPDSPFPWEKRQRREKSAEPLPKQGNAENGKQAGAGQEA